MIDALVNIETRDFELDSTGDIVKNTSENRFQDFWFDVAIERGEFILSGNMGIPYAEISQFGRIQATDDLLKSYILDKALKNNLNVTDVNITDRSPYTIQIKYIDENNSEKSNSITL